MKARILIGGDFFPGYDAEQYAVRNPEKIWGNALPLLKTADISMVNLEAPLTEKGSPILKDGPNLRLAPKIVDTLKAAEIDVVTLANNHILDFGEEGLDETISLCQENRIKTVGAGRNLAEAQETLYCAVNDTRIAIVNFAENEWSIAEKGHGGASPMDLIDNALQIKDAKNNADVVLVVIHGGHEYYRYPSPRMKKQYRFYAAQGASAVVAHHTHCYSGHEVYEGVPIFYSLGNLFFPARRERFGWNEGILLELVVDSDNTVSFRQHPYEQCKYGKMHIKILNEEESLPIVNDIQRLNNVIADDDDLNSVWQEYILTQKHRLSSISIRNRFLQKVLYRLGIQPRILFKKELLITTFNYFRCEAHKDVMFGVLSNYLESRKSRGRN